PTLVTLQILRSNDPNDEALRVKLSKPIPESEITATIKELRVHPALEAAREYLHSLANESKAMLKDLPAGPARKTLEGLCDAIVNRTA
ncbi:MAG: polyprenyl synthetase family protein, partial [Candidatus Nanopelagicaceae bacterium]